MEFKILLIIFIILVLLDKGITAMNVIQVNKGKTSMDYSIEKNPIAKWFFEKTGLFWGSLLFGITTIISMFIIIDLLSYTIMKGFGWNQVPADYQALWIIFIVYGFVLANNSFFFLKYSKII